MNRTLIIVFGLIFILAAGSAVAQKQVIGSGPIRQFAEDTAINPHDFTDAYYEMNGIISKGIIGRRDGTDGLSVFSNSSNPYHRNIRVIATIPAYDQNGDMIFWYPLGDLQDYGFTDDKVGVFAREMAMQFPIYVFPNMKILDYRTFANNRQAALMDNSLSSTNGQDVNPLGIRVVVVVNYTEKAFQKESYEMMDFMMKKNGASADDTPLIKTMDDLNMLAKHELVDARPWEIAGGRYTISTPIYDPTKGAIAQDAFLWMTTQDGHTLPSEDGFIWQFHCLKKTGNWCS